MTSRRLALSLILATLVAGGCAATVGNRAGQREAAAEAAYPPTGRFVTVNGARVHALTEGAGPDLVLIHGASGNLRDFTFALVGQLKTRYRVTAFDRPGLGWSDGIGPDGASPLVQADRLRAAAAELGITRPIVLGQSYGGAVALAWALRDPDGTAALVIVSGATMPWPGGLAPWYALTGSQIGGATVVPLISAFAPLSRADDVVAAIFAPDAVPAGYLAHVGPGLTLRRDTLRTNARQIRALKPHLQAMLPNYPALTLPVEILHGTADGVVSADIHAVPLAATLPDAHLTLLEHAGHMPHHSRIPEVIAAIDRAATRAGLR